MIRRFYSVETAAVNDQLFHLQVHIGDGRFVIPTNHVKFLSIDKCWRLLNKTKDSIIYKKLETGNGIAVSRFSTPRVQVKKNVEIGYAIRCSGKEDTQRAFNREDGMWIKGHMHLNLMLCQTIWRMVSTSSRKMKCHQF
ncbi:hypothetical protein BDZ45DRAFT_116507 [Acephala macrosclerotiorum]|nr:hypothetical protein BDZ45DRAFT_116507 [Acephala macrosclerotiorum]